MATDFRASQVQLNKLIASGSTGTNARLLVYNIDSDSATNPNQGNINLSNFNTSSIGQDVFLYVSGARDGKGLTTQTITCFGGDVYMSGNLSGIGLEAINVKNYGATGNGTTSDTTAIQNALNAAGTGSIVYFPSGTYFCGGLTKQDHIGLHLVGDGLNSVLKRDPAAGAGGRIITFGGDENESPFNCKDISISNLTFDVNGITGLGGTVFYNVRGLVVKDCHVRDSNLTWNINDSDHYWLVVLLSEDITVKNNNVLNTELIEANYCSRVKILNNIVSGSAGTSAIAWASVVTGVFAYDYEIAGNTIIDPFKSAIAMIHDGGMHNNNVQRINIHDNSIIHLSGSPNHSIVFGTINGQTGSGNIWNDITVNRNQINLCPGRSGSAIATSYYGTPTAPFTRFSISDNLISGGLDDLNDFQLSLQKLTNSEIVRNRVHGAASGSQFAYLSGCNISNNVVEAHKIAYSHIGTSLGKNTIENNIILGNPTRTWDLLDGTFLQTDNISFPKINYINVKDFGAKGDGIANDGAAIQNALNYLPLSGGIVFFPIGNYLITGTLQILNKSNTSLVGVPTKPESNTAVSGSCLIKSGSGTALEISNSLGSFVIGTQIDGIHLHNSGGTGDGIYIANSSKFVIRDCTIKGFNTSGKAGIKFLRTDFSSIKDCTITNNDYGVITENHANAYFNGTVFEKCDIENNSTANISLAGTGLSFIGCNFEAGALGAGISERAGNASSYGISFLGCYFESNTTRCIDIGQVGSVNGVVIQGCFFSAIIGTPTEYLRCVGNGIDITGNAFYGITGDPTTNQITFDNSTNINVVGNQGLARERITIAGSTNSTFIETSGSLTVSSSVFIQGPLNVSGTLTLATNAAGNPDLTWAGDSNTGLWHYDADSFALRSNGASVALITPAQFTAPTILADTITKYATDHIGLLTNTQVTGNLNVSGGITGSLTRLSNGSSYLLGIGGVSITTGSGGQVTISASAGGGGTAAGEANQIQVNNGSDVFSASNDLWYAPGAGLRVTGTAVTVESIFERDGAYIDSDSASKIQLFMSSNNGLGSDNTVGSLEFYGGGSGLSKAKYSSVNGVVYDATAAAERGYLGFNVIQLGAQKTPIKLFSSGGQAAFLNNTVPWPGAKLYHFAAEDTSWNRTNYVLFSEKNIDGNLIGQGLPLFMVAGDGTVMTNFSGSKSDPAYTHYLDQDTGVYFLSTSNSLGITAGGWVNPSTYTTFSPTAVTCSVSNSSTTGMELQLYHDKATAAAGDDVVGKLTGYGKVSDGTRANFGEIRFVDTVATAGSHRGSIQFFTSYGGALATTPILTLNAASNAIFDYVDTITLNRAAAWTIQAVNHAKLTLSTNTSSLVLDTANAYVQGTSETDFKLRVSGAIVLGENAVGTPDLTWGTDPDTGIWHYAANSYALRSNGASVALVSPSTFTAPTIETNNVNQYAATGITFGNDIHASANTYLSGGLALASNIYVNTLFTYYQIVNSNYFIKVSAPVGGTLIQMPDNPANGATYIIKDVAGNASTRNITISSSAGQTFETGGTTLVISTNFRAESLIWDSVTGGWYRLANI